MRKGKLKAKIILKMQITKESICQAFTQKRWQILIQGSFIIMEIEMYYGMILFERRK